MCKITVEIHQNFALFDNSAQKDLPATNTEYYQIDHSQDELVGYSEP